VEPNQAVTSAQAKLNQAVERFGEGLKSLRTGRANSAMLDGVMVEAYGTQMPLNQVGTVSAPEAQLLQITPFDPNNLAAISTAIRNNQNLGLNPSDDGRVVRKRLTGQVEDAMNKARTEAEVAAKAKEQEILTL
jgi:ribosome recycling factor